MVPGSPSDRGNRGPGPGVAPVHADMGHRARGVRRMVPSGRAQGLAQRGRVSRELPYEPALSLRHCPPVHRGSRPAPVQAPLALGAPALSTRYLQAVRRDPCPGLPRAARRGDRRSALSTRARSLGPEDRPPRGRIAGRRLSARARQCADHLGRADGVSADVGDLPVGASGRNPPAARVRRARPGPRLPDRKQDHGSGFRGRAAHVRVHRCAGETAPVDYGTRRRRRSSDRDLYALDTARDCRPLGVRRVHEAPTRGLGWRGQSHALGGGEGLDPSDGYRPVAGGRGAGADRARHRARRPTGPATRVGGAGVPGGSGDNLARLPALAVCAAAGADSVRVRRRGPWC